MLNEGGKAAILAGAGALQARQEVLAAAELLGAPVIKTLSGKAVIPDDSEFAVGGIGLLGTRPGESLVEDCDTLFMIGTNFPYAQHLPPPGKVRVVQIDADPTRACVRMPTEVPVIGDARESLQALIPLLTRKSDRGHLEKYQQDMTKWRQEIEALENPDRSPIAPQYPVRVLDDLAAAGRRPGRARPPSRAAAPAGPRPRQKKRSWRCQRALAFLLARPAAVRSLAAPAVLSVPSADSR